MKKNWVKITTEFHVRDFQLRLHLFTKRLSISKMWHEVDLKRCFTGLNSEFFPLPQTDCHPEVKEPSLSCLSVACIEFDYIYIYIYVYIRVCVQSSLIYIYIYMCVCVCVWERESDVYVFLCVIVTVWACVCVCVCVCKKLINTHIDHYIIDHNTYWSLHIKIFFSYFLCIVSNWYTTNSILISQKHIGFDTPTQTEHCKV